MNLSASPQPSPAKIYFFLILTTVLWGGSFVFNKLGFREIPPMSFLFFRFSLATVIMGCFCLPRMGNLSSTICRRGILIGLALFLANLTFVIGLNGTSATRAAFLNNLFVLFIPLICFLFWKDTFDRWITVGIVLAIAGIWQLAGGGTEGFSRGDLLSVICAFFIAVHIIAVSRLLGSEDVYLITLIQFATVALLGGILFALFPPVSLQLPGRTGIMALIYCAIFPTVVCFTIQNKWQRHTTPTQAGLIYTLDPVWSMLGGFLILGERLNLTEWSGCILVFCAVLLPLSIRRLRDHFRPGWKHAD